MVDLNLGLAGKTKLYGMSIAFEFETYQRTIFKVLALTSERTQHLSMTTINWLMLFKEIINGYSENNTKTKNALSGQNAEQ
jgi:hypothetical protein